MCPRGRWMGVRGRCMCCWRARRWHRLQASLCTTKGWFRRKRALRAGEKKLGYAGLCKLLARWHSDPEISWLKDAPTHLLQQALRDLERAYTHQSFSAAF